MKRILISLVLLATACGCLAAFEPPLVLEDRLAPYEPGWEAALSPDWAEPIPPAPAEPEIAAQAFAALTPAARQPQGALSGRIVYMNGGHGWTYDPNFSPPWRLMRSAPLLEMNEDYGNVDQLNFFAMYCFNAGAVVVPFRPLGQQTNEVVLDNVSPGVTFQGPWSDSVSTIFYGAPGALPYRYASLAASESATATYTPNIPRAGYYPVYTWARHGSDRGDQLYRIRHTGGETQVRIPHYMVGNGWIYLGEYYFNAGANAASGSVVISNLRSTSTGSVVIADAIRFGNGMGSADNGGGGSKYPREDESNRYWIKNSLGQGQSASLYDGSGNDESDSWSAPPKMTAEMNRQEAGDIHKRIHIGFHSNAGGGRGSIGLITGYPTPYQSALAQLIGKEVNDDLVALGSPPLEVPWYNRSSFTYSGGYSEIDGRLFNYEMAATIIEVAFHDNENDAKLLRDAKARAAVGKAAMHAVVKFFHQYDTNSPAPLAFLPEAPTNPRAIAVNTNGHITLSWTAPVSLGGSQPPTNYIIYVSTNGYGFGNPISVGNVISRTLTHLPPNVDYYFRISAANAGGESMPSEVVGCRAASVAGAPRVLVVNAFDRFDRVTNPRQNVTRQPSPYVAPNANGVIERVWPRRVNAFDYVVAHGKALAANGRAFDSCQNETIINNQVALANYPIVIWACGNESTADKTFNSTEQARLTAYLNNGGALFTSGSDIAYDLDRPSGPTPADRNFIRTQLRAMFANDNTGSYTATAVTGALFAGRASAGFDNGSAGIYWVRTPDGLTPYGAGAKVALNYSGGSGGAAAIQYDGSAGGGRVVFFGFPFETITNPARRTEYMQSILNFLDQSAPVEQPPTLATPPGNLSVVAGSNATLTVMASGTAPLSYQWRFNGANLAGATASSFTRANAQFAHSGLYQVVVSNAFGAITSSTALLTVTLPPTLERVFADNFDANTAANWTVNRSSTDTRVTFNYNYAADGIPAAPHSSGTTRGVKFEANMVNGTAAAINISPVGRNFMGDYRLRFDMWINANGPFPLGGNGSTEHLTAGVATAGNRVQWTGAGSTADGHWFAVDGEGQASDTSTTAMNDFDAFSGTTRHAAESGVFAAGVANNTRGNGHSYYATPFPGGQTAPAWQQSTYAQQTGGLAVGTVGLAWREVIITKRGRTVEWFINGLKIATINEATFTGNNIFVGYWDSFDSLSDNAALSFGLVDNIQVERYVTNTPPYLMSHPLSQTVTQGNNVMLTALAGGTAPLTYQWRQNGVNLAGATASSLTWNDVQITHSGNYALVVSNVAGSVTSAVATLTVVAPPTISTPPQSQTVPTGGNVTFHVVANGTPPLSYQWQFDGQNIAGATQSSYSLTSAQPGDAGTYTVGVTNAIGGVLSAGAVLTVQPPVPLQFVGTHIEPNGGLQLAMSGDPGVYVVEYSSTLTNWNFLAQLTNVTGNFVFTDAPITNQPVRFYRVRPAP
jgi:hypothetical protein